MTTPYAEDDGHERLWWLHVGDIQVCVRRRHLATPTTDPALIRQALDAALAAEEWAHVSAYADALAWLERTGDTP